jgi:2-methylcitrate dehydratase PrpD
MTRTRQLVEAVREITYERLEAADFEVVKVLLLDHLGVAVGGSATDSAQTVQRLRSRDVGRGSPSLPVIGTDLELPALAAAMANAVAAHSIEYDDVHNASSTHPGVVIFPAALAASALAGYDERAFLAGVAQGYELMCRVGRAAHPPAHYARHFHPTATTGTLGAAAAAAAILGLDEPRTVWAVGIAADTAAGSMQFLEDGAWTKRLHPAVAARNGVEAALLAADGFRGTGDGIAGDRGFLAGYSEAPRPGELLAGWGSRPLEVRSTSIKPHTCCRYNQGAIDALLKLRRAGLRPEETASVLLGVPTVAVGIVFEPVQAKRRPNSVVDAQFSLPYGAAVALARGRAGLPEYDQAVFADPLVRDLMDRVECIADPELDREYPERWGAWARVTTKDGRELEARIEDPRGDPTNPLSLAELRSKFDELAAPAYDRATRDRIAATVDGIAEPGALGELVKTLAQSGGSGEGACDS